MRFATQQLVLAAMVACILWVGPARSQAEVVLDHSPSVPGVSVTKADFANLNADQFFADDFSFNGSTLLNGMDIYGATTAGSPLGALARVRVWSDSAGQPGLILSQFDESISAVDGMGATAGNQRLHVDFSSPVLLSGGSTYWIGMTGDTSDLTQAGLSGLPGGDGKMFQFSNGSPVGFVPNGDMAFRLEGQSIAVPEPSTLILSSGALVLGSIYVIRHRRRAAA